MHGRAVIKMLDAEGLNNRQAFLEKVTAQGTWVDYKWKDPLSEEAHEEVLLGRPPQGLHLRLRHLQALRGEG